MGVKVLKISATIFQIRLLPVPVHKQNQEAFEGNQSAFLCSPPASLQQLPQGQGGGSVERVLQPGKNFSIAPPPPFIAIFGQIIWIWILPPPCQSPVPGEETKESKQQD